MIREYAYTTGTPGSVTRTVNIAYGNAWKDQMTSFDGQAITYDVCGNMLTRGTKSYTWGQGKQLASVSNGHTIQYQYDHKLIVSGTEYLKLASEGKSIEKPEDISKISDKTYPCPQYFSYLLCF